MVKTTLFIILAIILLMVYVRYIESRSIFFPMKKIEFTPGLVNLAFEDVYITTSDNIKLNGWFIPCDNARYTFLFCHGNAGNIGHRIEKIIIFREIGVNVFIIDYRGYGNSEGKPSERGIYLDAKAGYDYLVNTRKIKPEHIILFGESIGGAAVIDLASKVKVGALITEEAFSSARDMARRIYPFLPSFLYSVKLDSLTKIKKVDAPKLIIHSVNDEIVPFALGKKLFNAAKEPKQLVEIMGSHNTAFLDSKEKYTRSIEVFIQKKMGTLF